MAQYPLDRGYHDLLDNQSASSSSSSSWSKDFIRGPIHYDPEENLHTVVRGTKLFELFHPLQSGELYEQDATFRSAFLLYKWEEEEQDKKQEQEQPGGRHRLWSLPLTVAGATQQPFSPVNVASPDLSRHPRFANARRVRCEVKAGETLYVPSHWWHEVTSWGDAAATGTAASSPGEDLDGAGLDLSIGVNLFYEPFYVKTSRSTFVRNSFYAHLWDIVTSTSSSSTNRQTSAESSVETMGGLFGTTGSLLQASLSANPSLKTKAEPKPRKEGALDKSNFWV